MNSEKTKVALVDDHELMRNGLARIIERFEGYQVLFEADNGEDFIRQVSESEHPDIVLLDISMPVMDGYQTAEWLKKNMPKMRVLVLSMMDNEKAIIKMIQLGARGYILKDTKPAVLKQAFDQICAYGYYSNEQLTGKLIHQARENLLAEEEEFRITEREKEFLHHVCSELTYRDIAKLMNSSPRTIDNYRDALYRKFDIKSRVGLALFAIKHGYYII